MASSSEEDDAASSAASSCSSNASKPSFSPLRPLTHCTSSTTAPASPFSPVGAAVPAFVFARASPSPFPPPSPSSEDVSPSSSPPTASAPSLLVPTTSLPLALPPTPAPTESLLLFLLAVLLNRSTYSTPLCAPYSAAAEQRGQQGVRGTIWVGSVAVVEVVMEEGGEVLEVRTEEREGERQSVAGRVVCGERAGKVVGRGGEEMASDEAGDSATLSNEAEAGLRIPLHLMAMGAVVEEGEVAGQHLLVNPGNLIFNLPPSAGGEWGKKPSSSAFSLSKSQLFLPQPAGGGSE